MIRGVGIDLVEIDRFQSALKRHGDRLLAKVFTDEERRACEGRLNRLAHYAARFAAKEAVLKALGTGWSGGIAWTDVELAPLPNGALEARLSGRARHIGRKKKIHRIHVSITHTDRAAGAVAVAEG